MKTALDPRHIQRKKKIERIFAASYTNEVSKILPNLDKIDILISKAAPEWPIEKINRVDLSVLRLATSEILENKVPTKAIIDEAIELAKEYGSEESPGFINAVLGKIITDDTK